MFEVYATRWDSSEIVSQLIPAKGLSFSFPLCDHGEASFTAQVENTGRSFWRSSLRGVRSGILIAESQDNGPSIPLWAGRLAGEPQQGPRGFQFTAKEWGSAFDWFPAVEDEWDNVVDTSLVADIVTRVQQVSGQNLNVTPRIVQPTVSRSDLTVNPWDNRSAGDVLDELSNREGGPEWYAGVGGSLRNPERFYALAQTHGDQLNPKVLEYVEDTPDAPGGSHRQQVALLSSLFPGQPPQWSTGRLGRRGGNVLSFQRVDNTDRSATVIVAYNGNPEGAQLRATAVAQNLIDAGFPRITRTVSFSDVKDLRTLQRHADAELRASAGLLTGYQVVTRGSRPDWRQITRGSLMKLIADTDVYAGARPLTVSTRLLNMTIAVPDDGGQEQVRWDFADVLEVA